MQLARIEAELRLDIDDDDVWRETVLGLLRNSTDAPESVQLLGTPFVSRSTLEDSADHFPLCFPCTMKHRKRAS